MFWKTLFVSLLFFLACFCSSSDSKTKPFPLVPPPGMAYAAFAEGCFWCSEHIFESILGVKAAVSGYAGGHTENPNYEIVNTETTGHAETVLVLYDPKQIQFAELCRIFFLSHDPTTKDKQGPDVGSSYRSILFYQNEAEKEIALKIWKEIEANKIWQNKFVTELQMLKAFTQAEDYHQDFIQKNPNQTYVRYVSLPRFEDFQIRYKKYKARFQNP